jgi:hypothetical protein
MDSSKILQKPWNEGQQKYENKENFKDKNFSYQHWSQKPPFQNF